MSENYTESIVVPKLLQKIQELQTANVVLDINLQVEQAKVSNYQTTANQTVSHDKERIHTLEDQLRSAHEKIADLKRERQNLEVDFGKLKHALEIKINTLEEEIRVLKTASTPTSKKQRKTIELEGGVF
jgi:TolA-binding protein